MARTIAKALPTGERMREAVDAAREAGNWLERIVLALPKDEGEAGEWEPVTFEKIGELFDTLLSVEMHCAGFASDAVELRKRLDAVTIMREDQALIAKEQRG